MTKEDLLKIDGEIEEVLPNGMFRVNIGGNLIVTYISGKVRKNKINIIQGDKVAVEVSAYDLTKGRIVYRYK
jgi:translation initiation factor IF-1